MKDFKIDVTWIVMIGIGILYIFPFLFITQYAFLTADDFCRTSFKIESFFERIYNWYLHHNGRYTNAILGSLPVYELKIYRLVLASLFLIFGISIYHFLKSLFIYLNLILYKKEITFLSITLYIILIALLPSVFEFFYWYAASSSYLLSAALFLLILKFLFDLEVGRRKDVVFPSILVILLIGNNELFIPITVIILIAFLIRYYLKGRVLFYKAILLNSFSWLAISAIFFSPGTNNRKQIYSQGGNINFSINSSIESTIEFIPEQMIRFPFALVYVGLFCYLWWVASRQKGRLLKVINPIVLLICSFFIFSSVLFVPYYAQGFLEVYKERIGNIIHLFFLLLLFINILNFAIFSSQIFSFKSNILLKIAGVLIGVFFILLPFKNKNYRQTIGDFKNNRFEKYQQDIKGRLLFIRNSKIEELKLKEIKGTQILKHYELSMDPEYWENACFVKYINQKFSLNVQTVRIE